MVLIAEVKLRKDLRLGEAIQHLAHERDGVAVLDSNSIEGAIINE